MRMSNEEVERVFIRLRWADNKGEPYCPHCGCPTVYACRRPGRAPRWRCKACQKGFLDHFRNATFRPTLQCKNMMAANYRHIGGGENRLGRHYSRFSGIGPGPSLPINHSLC
jgi:transposase-like protein